MPLLAAYRGPAMLDEDGGAIRTRVAVARLAEALGDSVVTDEVLSLHPTGRGTVEVLSVVGREEYASVVVCAGLGTARLARNMGLSLPIRSAAHVRLTFQVRGAPPERVACLQDSSGDFGEVGVYAAPYPGNSRYAVGLSQTVEVREDGSVVDPEALAALSDRAGAYVSRALPRLDPEPVEHLHCWVTSLPWSEDGIAVWEADRVFFRSRAQPLQAGTSTGTGIGQRGHGRRTRGEPASGGNTRPTPLNAPTVGTCHWTPCRRPGRVAWLSGCAVGGEAEDGGGTRCAHLACRRLPCRRQGRGLPGGQQTGDGWDDIAPPCTSSLLVLAVLQLAATFLFALGVGGRPDRLVALQA
ncbi:FAD-dependent oxidoreductase [Streptomyces scabiei]